MATWEDNGPSIATRNGGEENWRWWSGEPHRRKIEFVAGDEMVAAWFQGDYVMALVAFPGE